jgi:hypothetical protein
MEPIGHRPARKTGAGHQFDPADNRGGATLAAAERANGFN